jgi:dihydrofolate reductase
MIIKLIIAIDKNGVMGLDNKLPWRLRDDLKHFKKVTDNFPLIMGSNTFTSLPGILPNREHLVLSNTLYGDENMSVFTSIQEALQYVDEAGYSEVFVIGGANVIRQFAELNLFDELIITHVNCEVEGDTIIDIEDLNISSYNCYNTIEHSISENNEFDFKIKFYKKIIKRFYQ